MKTILHSIPPQIYGTLFLMLGLLIRYLIGRRRFNRRGIGGLQHFSGYGQALLTTLLERLFGWLAIVLIASGFLLMVAS